MNTTVAKPRLLPLVLALGLIGGCGILPESKKIDYKSASTAKAPTLEVPPDLTQLPKDDRYTVPDRAGRGSATYSAYAENRNTTAKPQNSTVLPEVDKVRFERSGSERWLVVSLPADKIWDTVRDFWQETGFVVKMEMPEAGVMETDWAENRAKIPDDFLRNALGKILDSLYSTGERDKFRTRLEPGVQAGTTDVFISHRGMVEVYTSSAKDETRWQPRQPDPELEAEMLRRLMVRFGTEEKKAEAAVAAAAVPERAKLLRSEGGAGALMLEERFDRAWRRVGLALDRVGFTVEDRDRNNGLYFVRYVDPDADNKKDDKGWMSKLAFWKGEDKDVNRTQYRIHVKDEGEKVRLVVLSKEGGADGSDTAKKILGLLYGQLK